MTRSSTWSSGPGSRRSGCAARRSSAATWRRCSTASTFVKAIPVIRAFSHFALLANVAEDIHRERRRAIHVDAGDPPQDSSLAATYREARRRGARFGDRRRGTDRRLVSPVITAHPTETRRRTVFDTQHRITQLMRLHAQGEPKTDDDGDIDTELRRQVLMLWQTALVRLSRLQISDEIAVGLRYYRGSVFRGGAESQRRGPRRTAPAAGPTPTCLPNRFCGRARGSAATATATPTSPRTWCGWPPAARPTRR